MGAASIILPQRLSEKYLEEARELLKKGDYSKERFEAGGAW